MISAKIFNRTLDKEIEMKFISEEAAVDFVGSYDHLEIMTLSYDLQANMVIEVIKGSKATPIGIYTVQPRTFYDYKYLSYKITKRLLTSGKAIIRMDLKSKAPDQNFGARIIEKISCGS